MSNFDFYMIDTIKEFADRARDKNSSDEAKWAMRTVLDELVHVYSEYKQVESKEN
jgi:hypothetical protein